MAEEDNIPFEEKRTVTPHPSQSVVKESSPPADSFVMAEFNQLPEDQGLIGQTVAGRYRVLKKLGEGGMGVVFLAEHITIEKRIALKVLLQEYARKLDIRDRFLQEAKAAARINHENIVDITDFGTTPDQSVFFAMEFLEGQDLSKVIRKDGPIHWSRAKPILLQICRALGAAHTKGIIHRDMKPENIYLIEREGRADFVKVLDFGIAKMSIEQTEKKLTRTGMIFGTPEYMSPEQAQGNSPDHRVDIYAVGVIMYEMMTGQVPFKADTFMGILTKHIFEEPVLPSEVNPDAHVPLEVEEIILKAMAKNRDDRFQTMAEMSTSIARAEGRMTRPTGDNPHIGPRMLIPVESGTRTTSNQSTAHAETTDFGITKETLYQSSNRGKLTIIGVLVVLVVGSGVLAALFLGKGGEGKAAIKEGKAAIKGQPDPDQTIKIAKMIRIKISSTPSGALVFRGVPSPDKSPLGQTPAVIKLPQDNQTTTLLTLRLAGHKDLHQKVSLAKDTSIALEMVPERAQAVKTTEKRQSLVKQRRDKRKNHKRKNYKRNKDKRNKDKRNKDKKDNREKPLTTKKPYEKKPDPTIKKQDPTPPTKVNDLMNPFKN